MPREATVALMRSVLREYVDGNASESDLRAVGVEIGGTRDVIVIDSDDVMIRVFPAEVATTLLKLRDEPVAAQRWARIILAGADTFDLSDEFETESGNRVLEDLWDAAFQERKR